MDLDFSHTLVLKLIGQIHIHGGADFKLIDRLLIDRDKPDTGSPRLMRISLLRFLKTFQKNLGYFGFKNCTNEKISQNMHKPNSSNELAKNCISQKFALMQILAYANFPRIFPSPKSRIKQGPPVHRIKL